MAQATSLGLAVGLMTPHDANNKKMMARSTLQGRILGFIFGGFVTYYLLSWRNSCSPNET